MSFGVPAILTAAQAAVSGFSAYSSIRGGQAQARALDQQAKARQLQARYTDVQADQAAAGHQEQLRTALSTIRALRASRGGKPGAGGAIEAEVSRRANAGERIDLLGFSAERAAFLREAAGLRDARGAALVSGVGSAAGSLIDAANAASRLVPRSGRNEDAA